MRTTLSMIRELYWSAFRAAPDPLLQDPRRSYAPDHGQAIHEVRTPHDQLLRGARIHAFGLSAPKRRVEFCSVEADDGCSVDDSDGGRHESEPLQFLNRGRVLCDIAFLVLDVLLRKILFRPLAEHSAGLRKNRYLLCHSMFASFGRSTSAAALVLMLPPGAKLRPSYAGLPTPRARKI